METNRTNERIVEETRHANGVIKTRTIRYEFKGQTYETIRFFSESGVYYNFINRPARVG